MEIGGSKVYLPPVFADVSDRKAQARKLQEEAAECMVAANRNVDGEDNFGDVVEEFCDTVQAMVNFIESFGLDPKGLNLTMNYIIDKNEKRGRY